MSVIDISEESSVIYRPLTRMRRLRGHPRIRSLVCENRLSTQDLVYPLFVKAGDNIKQPLVKMPGVFQWSMDRLPEKISEIQAMHIPAVIIFGIPQHKDVIGSDALDNEGIIAKAIQTIKSLAPELLVIADCCFCEYTDHGHCGVLDDNHSVNNDKTLNLLASQALVLAEAGADMIAPSGMMDGMVGAVRLSLDSKGYQHIPILSYSVKFASAFYGPFREAAESAPKFGDRHGYQMNPANSNLSLREAELDIAEGADMIMVKPAQNYLDVIFRIKSQYPSIPLGAYQVSGEYAMIKAAAQNGMIDEKAAVLESLLAIKRAGADFIITYFAMDVSRYLK